KLIAIFLYFKISFLSTWLFFYPQLYIFFSPINYNLRKNIYLIYFSYFSSFSPDQDIIFATKKILPSKTFPIYLAIFSIS
ncbi:hypothetical protein COX69_00325, partial [Candidatus Falkowbacteria bacterium CG_4_10_14_0_2_um_filter_48_10]